MNNLLKEILNELRLLRRDLNKIMNVNVDSNNSKTEIELYIEEQERKLKNG